MPQFAPSEVKSARAPITVQPAGLSCNAELYLVSNGAKVATSGVKVFTSSGAKQDISLPITMPSAEGTYPVYLDIFTNGLLIGAYKAIEDVVIAPPGIRTVRAYWKGTGVALWLRENGVTFNGKREIDPALHICTASWTLYSTFIVPIDARITQIEFKLLGVYGYTVCFDYRWTDQKPGEAERTIAQGTKCPPYEADIYHPYTHYTIPVS